MNVDCWKLPPPKIIAFACFYPLKVSPIQITKGSSIHISTQCPSACPHVIWWHSDKVEVIQTVIVLMNLLMLHQQQRGSVAGWCQSDDEGGSMFAVVSLLLCGARGWITQQWGTGEVKERQWKRRTRPGIDLRTSIMRRNWPLNTG